MKVILTTTIDTDGPGEPRITTKIKARGFVAGERATIKYSTKARISRPALSSDEPTTIDVTDGMRTAARRTFLSPERVKQLGHSLSDAYRAMEKARRSGD